MRLVPFLMICYIIAYIDRVDAGFAALQMNQHLGLTAAMFGFGATLFYVAYTAFEIPSNVLMAKVGPRLWIARIMITWGLCGVAAAFATGPYSFYATRFLLGAAEAGFFPGAVFYLTLWFPIAYRSRVMAAFGVAVPLSVFVGSPISGALLHLDGMLNLRGWQWLFIMEFDPSPPPWPWCVIHAPEPSRRGQVAYPRAARLAHATARSRAAREKARRSYVLVAGPDKQIRPAARGRLCRRLGDQQFPVAVDAANPQVVSTL